jgi:hypothetical protein
MEDFLATVLSFPTVVYTTGLGVVLVYWLTVILGALDVDVFGVDGDLDMDVDIDVADADGGADGVSGLAAILTALRLRHAPLTVSVSVLTLAAWLFSYVGTRVLVPLLPLPSSVSAALVGLAALGLALPVTSLVTRPLGPLFVLHQGKNKQSFVGGMCTVRTGRVDGKEGQALIEDGGAGLLVRVRCDDPLALARGDQAIITAYDADEDVYDVEPLRALLPKSDEGMSDS